jgi:ABC-2 type transport system ATP-binding protein
MTISGLAAPTGVAGGQLPHVSPEQLAGAIRFVGVTVDGAGSLALDDVSFEVPRGGTLALAGLTDGAATAVAEVVLGLRPVERGLVRVLGLEPAVAVASGRVGALVRPAGLPGGARVDEVVRFVRRLHPVPLPFDDLVARAGLEGILGRPVDRLTGDEMGRLRLALALAGDPDVVVMDDPAAGLGPGARRGLAAAIRRLNAEGRTVLVAAGPGPGIAVGADRVLVLERGRLVGERAAPAEEPG